MKTLSIISLILILFGTSTFSQSKKEISQTLSKKLITELHGTLILEKDVPEESVYLYGVQLPESSSFVIQIVEKFVIENKLGYFGKWKFNADGVCNCQIVGEVGEYCLTFYIRYSYKRDYALIGFYYGKLPISETTII